MSPFLSRLAATIALATAACGRLPDTDPRMVSEWMHTLYGVIRAERLSPPVASRVVAYASVALYEGLASGRPALPSLTGVLNGLPELPRPGEGERVDPTLVALAAKEVVLDSLLVEALPATRATLAGLVDSLRRTRGASGIYDEVRGRSEDLGRRIGAAIVAWSRTDGYDATRGLAWTPPRGPGYWVNDAPASTYASQNVSGATEFVALDNPANLLSSANTGDRGMIMNRPKPAGLTDLPPVNMAGASEPYWGRIRPFMLRTWNECPVPEPPGYSEEPGSPIHREAMAVYQAKAELSPEQRTIALYWADNTGESGTPVGHWLAIGSQMVSQRRLDADDAARLYVLAAVAQADAFIASWGYKYDYNLIRPRTYIRRVIDPAWEPAIPTPPFPEYPSGHSTQSAAAATVMTMLLGEVAFDDSTSLAVGHEVRRFRSFREAADEAGLSRIYGGIHFPIGNTGGQSLGQCIGERVAERLQAAGQ